MINLDVCMVKTSAGQLKSDFLNYSFIITEQNNGTVETITG